jgi:hypothetical protein
MRPDDARRDVHFYQFFYRVNPDKAIDSICAFCYMTPATAETHAELHLRARPSLRRVVKLRGGQACCLQSPRAYWATNCECSSGF